MMVNITTSRLDVNSYFGIFSKREAGVFDILLPDFRLEDINFWKKKSLDIRDLISYKISQ